MSTAAIAKLQQITETHEDRIDDHEKRIREIEKANLKLAIQVGAISGGIPTLWAVFGPWIMQHLK